MNNRILKDRILFELDCIGIDGFNSNIRALEEKSLSFEEFFERVNSLG